ncbi:MAG: hypothetical protein QG556_658 [Pseudomonadota bacterium]|nr:hypothetical protein [Pseudomonadota bacterium]
MMRFIVLLCISSGLFAWNAKVHQLIGELALARVKPQTRYHILQVFKQAHTHVDAVSVWMDEVGSDKKSHYINLPFGQTYYLPKHLASQNALVAIENATRIMGDLKSSDEQKIMAMRVLFHVIADIHQPLHTTNFYSKRYPEGDRGGNLYLLPRHSGYRNLHQLWDAAGGLDISKQHFTCHDDLKSPIQWVQDSFLIAVHEVYFPPHSRKKMKTYQMKVKYLSQQQIQKAACHLAAYLDEIYVM